MSQFVDNALKQWSSFLLEINSDPGPYEHHLFFLDFISDVNNLDVSDMFQWYLLRGFDSTIVYNSTQVFSYTKLPGLIFWSSIKPYKLEGWCNTLISKEGVIKPPQSISQAEFAEYLLDRAMIGLRIKEKLSTKQRDQIIKTLLKNPEKTINSNSFKVWLREKSLK